MLKKRGGMIITLLIFFIVSILIIFFNKSSKTVENSNFINNNVRVSSFEAIPNDNVDDTLAIQMAINVVGNKGGGTVIFSEGVYLIDAVKSIKLKDNINLQFNKDTILKALPNDKSSYEIIEIHDVENVSIKGNAVIEGERKEHTGTTGEWGMGISIRGSENIHLENLTVRDCWGDGIYIGSTEKKNFNKNITIENSILENNRRQGISVISAINLKIVNPIVKDTRGTSPESGIDLEPNEPTDRLQNIEINNPSTENNKGFGILIFLENLKNSPHPVSITVKNTKNVKDDIQIVKPDYVKGTVKTIIVK
ncbi:right-handed parallel beta-helix repeat-containing protein [Peribacillus butanolivorans]|uniref:right-handed parallel beta-helix repeat-containing protein n=1 Tax=Peribacillus butanolivorans TaxID=421767 RepID=UPI003823299B